MKLVVAVTRPSGLDEVHSALVGVGVHGLMVSEMKGRGRQSGHVEIYRGAEDEVVFASKPTLETVVPDEAVASIMAALGDAAVDHRCCPSLAMLCLSGQLWSKNVQKRESCCMCAAVGPSSAFLSRRLSGSCPHRENTQAAGAGRRGRDLIARTGPIFRTLTRQRTASATPRGAGILGVAASAPRPASCGLAIAGSKSSPLPAPAGGGAGRTPGAAGIAAGKEERGNS